MRKVNYPDDLEMPKDEFIEHKLVELVLKGAATQAVANWETFTGATLKEKYEGLYVKIQELTYVIMAKGGKGFFWIVASPQLESVLELAKPGFVAAPAEQMPLGYNMTLFTGILEKRWRVYIDPMLDASTMVIGAGFSKKAPEYYAVFKLENFVK